MIFSMLLPTLQGLISRCALFAAALACAVLPVAADCYDIVGCSDRDLFSKRVDYLESKGNGPNCQFLREMRYAILAQHDHCRDFAEDAVGPGACRSVDASRIALSSIERANFATIRRAEATKSCAP